MSRHGSRSTSRRPTTPRFTRAPCHHAELCHLHPSTRLEGRRATIDTMLGLVRLCETRGWDHREPGVGGRYSQHKTMYEVEGDLADAPEVVPAVAGAVGAAAVMRAGARYPASVEDQARFEVLCRRHGILPI